MDESLRTIKSNKAAHPGKTARFKKGEKEIYFKRQLTQGVRQSRKRARTGQSGISSKLKKKGDHRWRCHGAIEFLGKCMSNWGVQPGPVGVNDQLQKEAPARNPSVINKVSLKMLPEGQGEDVLVGRVLGQHESENATTPKEREDG